MKWIKKWLFKPQVLRVRIKINGSDTTYKYYYSSKPQRIKEEYKGNVVEIEII